MANWVYDHSQDCHAGDHDHGDDDADDDDDDDHPKMLIVVIMTTKNRPSMSFGLQTCFNVMKSEPFSKPLLISKGDVFKFSIARLWFQ